MGDLRSLWHPCDRTNIRSPTSSISSAWRWDVPIEAAGLRARGNGSSDLARAPRYAGKVARHPLRPPSPLEPPLSLAVNDIRPGEEDVRRTAARELGTGVQDRQSTRNSSANHHLSSAHGARTQGGRGAQVLHPLLGSRASSVSRGAEAALLLTHKSGSEPRKARSASDGPSCRACRRSNCRQARCMPRPCGPAPCPCAVPRASRLPP